MFVYQHTPIARVPADVGRLLFEECFHAHCHEERITSALILASVCRAWRAIAFDLSVLWSAVHIDLRRLHEEPDEHWKAILRRSRRHPLDVQIVGFYDEDKLELVRMRNAVLMLLPHLDRWRSMSIGVVTIESLTAILPLWVDEAPLLETLSFSNVAHTHRVSRSTSTLSFDPRFSAPRLSTLELLSTRLSHQHRIFCGRFPGIRKLTLECSLDSGTFLDGRFLAQCLGPLKSLQRLELVASGYVEFAQLLEDGYTHGLIELPMLKELALSYKLAEYTVQDILMCIKAPQLTTLIITPAVALSWDDPLPFMLKTRFPSLRTVQLGFDHNMYDPFCCTDFFQIFGSFEHLELLNLQLVRINQEPLEFVDVLSKCIENTSCWNLPRLISVQVRDEGDVVAASRRLVEARLAASSGDGPHSEEKRPSCLEKLSVESIEAISEEDRVWFESHLQFFEWNIVPDAGETMENKYLKLTSRPLTNGSECTQYVSI
ncbi:hypothetical protein POSPLADRAFT_1131386 [Postia placenta MAD-698-R-SB12]|uniref:F-box domain-containing protein n=1 Tax=Postia placenta MAD-698-R-SB12 TaxID=670580 RepID=A0A1X6NBR6_9APHY|nr:hypothetical protein POSPLADRAFT_1131386 [Postia placenta MAD-698-R-SB12]OSX65833.1 hypothetical protein POSPLADRAFT_1131386 [Postia placenta MAD-698-R-SB12]